MLARNIIRSMTKIGRVRACCRVAAFSPARSAPVWRRSLRTRRRLRRLPARKRLIVDAQVHVLEGGIGGLAVENARAVHHREAGAVDWTRPASIAPSSCRRTGRGIATIMVLKRPNDTLIVSPSWAASH